jgi:hypothetical protein
MVVRAAVMIVVAIVYSNFVAVDDHLGHHEYVPNCILVWTNEN